jgi:hypothetical protein
MKILSIAICRWNEDTEEPVVLHNNHEVSEFGFFQRSGCVSFLSLPLPHIFSRVSPSRRT